MTHEDIDEKVDASLRRVRNHGLALFVVFFVAKVLNDYFDLLHFLY